MQEGSEIINQLYPICYVAMESRKVMSGGLKLYPSTKAHTVGVIIL